MVSSNESQKVLLDTNFLMLPHQFKIDIIQQIKKLVPRPKIITLKQVIQELDKIKGKVGKEIIQKYDVEVIDFPGENVDDVILEYAKKNKAVVCTNDKELKNRLRKESIPVIYMRGKKKCQLKGVIK